MDGRREVLGREHLHGVVLGEGRAHGVRAGGLLAPDRSELQVHLAGPLDEVRSTVEPEQRAVGIADQGDVILVADVIDEAAQDRRRDRERMVHPPRLHLLLVELHRREPVPGIQAGLTGALPGALDHLSNRNVRRAASGRLPSDPEIVGTGKVQRAAAPVLSGIDGDPVGHGFLQCDSYLSLQRWCNPTGRTFGSSTPSPLRRNTMSSQLQAHPDARAFAARTHSMLIGGQWVEAAHGKTFETFDPATGEVLAVLPAGDSEDIDRAVKTARAAFENPAWRHMHPAQRGKLLHKLGDLILEHADELATLETLDNGKPFAVARAADVPLAADLFHYMAGWATKLNGSTIALSVPYMPDAQFHAYTLREPIGVVGQIIPWNFPLLMAAWKLGPALTTGCTVVLKPAEQTPLSALRLGELIQEAGFPDGVVNIVTGSARMPALRWPRTRMSTRSPSPARRRWASSSCTPPPTT